jgi:MFS family permease
LFVYVLIALSILYFVGSLSSSVVQHLLVLVPLGAVSGVSNTLVSSLVSKEVDPTLRGGTLGLSAALGSLTRVVAPLVGTYMVQHSGPSTPGVVCAAICVPLAFLAWNISKIPRKFPKVEEKQQSEEKQD